VRIGYDAEEARIIADTRSLRRLAVRVFGDGENSEHTRETAIQRPPLCDE